MAISLRTTKELEERIEFLKLKLEKEDTSDLIKHLINQESNKLGFISSEVGNMEWIAEMARIAAVNNIRRDREVTKDSILYPLKEVFNAFEMVGSENLDFAEAAASGAPFLDTDERFMTDAKIDEWQKAVKLFREQFEKRGPSLLNKDREIKAAYYLFYAKFYKGKDKPQD